MLKLDDEIKWLTLGIKFNRSFRMTDVTGEIVDDILTNARSPFNEKIFPKIETSKWEKVLHNEDTGEYLRVNTDDLILSVRVDKDFDIKFEWLKETVLSYFKEHLFHKYKIKNIRRFGVVFLHEIVPNEKLRTSVGALTNGTIIDPSQITVSFSKKDVAVEGLLKKGVNDYKNHIYSLQEEGKSVNATLDCQYYYDPIIEDLRDCFTESILDDAKKHLHESFQIWLMNYAANPPA